MFPDADVGVQQGVDVRKSSTDDLHAADIISHSTLHAIEHGRKWDHEHSTKGGVGLAQALRLALKEDLTQPILVLEADCLIKDKKRFHKEVTLLLEHTDRFDMAVFGALYKGSPERMTPVGWLPERFHRIKDPFWLMHCVLYTPSGRRIISDILSRPLEMQIDSLIGYHARRGDVRVLAQLDRYVDQHMHVSNIQNTFSIITESFNSHRKNIQNSTFVLVSCLVLGICTGLYIRRRTLVVRE